MEKQYQPTSPEPQGLYRHSLWILLGNLGIQKDFNKGKFSCKFCNAALNRENAGALFSKEQSPEFACRKLECLKKVSEGEPYKFLYWVSY